MTTEKVRTKLNSPAQSLSLSLPTFWILHKSTELVGTLCSFVPIGPHSLSIAICKKFWCIDESSHLCVCSILAQLLLLHELNFVNKEYCIVLHFNLCQCSRTGKNDVMVVCGSWKKFFTPNKWVYFCCHLVGLPYNRVLDHVRLTDSESWWWVLMAGGTFALYSLLCRHAKLSLLPNQQAADEDLSTYKLKPPPETTQGIWLKKLLEKHEKLQTALLIIVLLGTCMIIGDGVLTPAISGTSFCFPGFFRWLFTVVFCLAHVTNCAIFP